MHDFFGDLLNGVLSTRIFRNSWVQHVEATCFHMVRFMSPIFPSPKELMGHDQKQRRIEQCSKPLAGLIISLGIILPFYISLYTGDYNNPRTGNPVLNQSLASEHLSCSNSSKGTSPLAAALGSCQSIRFGVSSMSMLHKQPDDMDVPHLILWKLQNPSHLQDNGN